MSDSDSEGEQQPFNHYSQASQVVDDWSEDEEADEEAEGEEVNNDSASASANQVAQSHSDLVKSVANLLATVAVNMRIMDLCATSDDEELAAKAKKVAPWVTFMINCDPTFPLYPTYIGYRGKVRGLISRFPYLFAGINEMNVDAYEEVFLTKLKITKLSAAYELSQTPEQKAKKALAKKAEADAALLLAKENDKKLKKAMEQRIRKQMEKQQAEDEANNNLGVSATDDAASKKHREKERRAHVKFQKKMQPHLLSSDGRPVRDEDRYQPNKTSNKRFTVTMDNDQTLFLASGLVVENVNLEIKYHQHLESQFGTFLEKYKQSESFENFITAHAEARIKMKAEAEAKLQAKAEANQIDEDSISAGSGGGGEEEGESAMDEGEEVSELGSVGSGSVGEDSLNSFGENVGVGGLSAGPSTTPPLPKPRGRAPKGKVWDEVVGWVDDPAAAEEAEAEESGDAKRAKLAVDNVMNCSEQIKQDEQTHLMIQEALGVDHNSSS